eukprot:5984957-Pleurochrysis_carterae.AAC.1
MHACVFSHRTVLFQALRTSSESRDVYSSAAVATLLCPLSFTPCDQPQPAAAQRPRGASAGEQLCRPSD